MSNEELFTDLESTLANHDWFYMMSDDHGVYTRGRAAYAAMERKFQTAVKVDSARANALWNKYKKSV